MVDRSWILLSSGHLFTDVNPAEYGFLSVISDFGERSVGQQLWDPVTRRDLLHAFRLVGNQMHGTLGALGVVMLAVSQVTDGVLGTGFLRAFGLGQATLTVALWLVGLWRATRSIYVVTVFTALAVMGPPVWLGLNLLCWGTHETVGLFQAALVCVALPWMAQPETGRSQWVRTAVLGIAAGVAVLLNPSLALPGVSVTLGVAVAPWLEQPSGREAARSVGRVGLGIVLGLMALQGVLALGWLDGLGYPRGIPLDRLTGFIGKNGGPLLHPKASDPAELARWASEARSLAFLQAPTEAYGAHAVIAEQATRVGILAVAVLAASLLIVRRWADDQSHRFAAAWVGTHLLLGLAATLFLTRHMSLDPTVSTGAPPRYFAHLYPYGFAVLALVGGPSRAILRRILAMLVTGWVLWVGAFEHARCVDTARLDWEEAQVALRYDGAAAWFTDRPASAPASHRRPFPEESDDFRRGYAVITGLQSSRYWSWTRPVDLARAPTQVAERFARSLRPSDDVTDPDAYWRGVGTALRVAVPKSRMVHAANFWKQHRRWSDAVREGYDSLP